MNSQYDRTKNTEKLKKRLPYFLLAYIFAYADKMIVSKTVNLQFFTLVVKTNLHSKIPQNFSCTYNNFTHSFFPFKIYNAMGTGSMAANF